MNGSLRNSSWVRIRAPSNRPPLESVRCRNPLSELVECRELRIVWRTVDPREF